MTDPSQHRSSQESEDSTSASPEQDSSTPSSASPTPTGDECSPDIGRESRAPQTCESFNWQAGGSADFLGMKEGETDALHKGQTPAVLISSAEVSPAKTSPSPGDDVASPGSDLPSSSSSPGSPMSLFGPEDGFWSRTSLDSSPAAPVSDVESVGSFYDSIASAGVSLATMEDEIIASTLLTWAALTTWPTLSMMKGGAILEVAQAAVRVRVATRPDASLPTTTAPSSRWSARSSAKSGFTTSPGECWIADTSECPSGGAASSSLPDVLEADVPPRFYLTPKAAGGILRRATKRGRALPAALETALKSLRHSADTATAPPPREPTTTPTSPEQSPDGTARDQTAMSQGATSSPTPSPARSPTRPDGMGSGRTDRGSTASPSPSLPTSQRIIDGELAPTLQAQTSEARGGTEGPKMLTGGMVRRLTPTECERLQGFPDGWTWTP